MIGTRIEDWVRLTIDHLSAALSISTTAAQVSLSGVALAILAVVIYLIAKEMGRKSPIRAGLISLALPLITALVMASLGAFRGSPDPNCHLYNGGREKYQLISLKLVPVNPKEPHGARSMSLLVRSDRWGDELHLCTLPFGHPRAQALYNLLVEMQKRQQENQDPHGRSEGVFIFSFSGSSVDKPDVRFVPNNIEGIKEHPPESPQGSAPRQ